MSTIKKSLIQEAVLDARSIEDLALSHAKKELEEALAPKIREIANQALKEYEKSNLTESVNLNISDDSDLHITVGKNGASSEVENLPTGTEGEDLDEYGEEHEMPKQDALDATHDKGESEDDNNINTIEDMDEVYEVEGLNEDEGVLSPDATSEPTASATPATPAPTEEPSAEGPATLETLSQKLDDALAKLSAIENGEQVGGEDGEVSIIDDDQPQDASQPSQQPAPVGQAPASTAAPAGIQESEFDLDEESTDEDIVYEMEGTPGANDDEIIYEFENNTDDENLMELFNEIDSLDEIEIVDEDTDDNMSDEKVDEMLGVSYAAEKRTGRRDHTSKQKGNHNPQAPLSNVALRESINKIKVQYGGKLSELKKENESLKTALKEYKESFVMLRKQINEVQVFNAKLAHVNTLFTNGGLTNSDKKRIVEAFDKVGTINDSKKLYTSFLTEMNNPVTKTNPVDKLKSGSPAVISSSNATLKTNTLFESEESKRMKRLAGLSKEVEE